MSGQVLFLASYLYFKYDFLNIGPSFIIILFVLTLIPKMEELKPTLTQINEVNSYINKIIFKIYPVLNTTGTALVVLFNFKPTN